MKPMCDTIKAQRAAFKVSPGNIETYLNWPIYRNTITAGGLMLEKMKTLPKSNGDETMSPMFGLPSGDFGCTLECTGAYKEYASLFMPVAGKYYDDANIKASLPDYCVAGKDKRRSGSINEGFAGKTNHQANILDTKPSPGKDQAPGFTCFATGTGKMPSTCPADAYDEAAQGLVAGITGGPKWMEPFVKFMGDFFARIGGRWDYHVHDIPSTAGRFVIPPDGANMKEEFTWYTPGKEKQPLPAEETRPPRVEQTYKIEVLTASYGANCPARGSRSASGRRTMVPQGNQTRNLAAECNGKTSCAYVVDIARIGDPSVGCAKDYLAKYRCASYGDVKSVLIPAEAGYRKTLALSCAALREDTSFRRLVPTTMNIVRLQPMVLSTAMIVPLPLPRAGNKAPYCYQALGYDGRTIAPDFATLKPIADHSALNKKQPYSIQYYVSNAFNSIGQFLSGTLNAAFTALKQKVCKWVDEKVQMAYNALIGTPVGKACADLYCKASSTEIPMNRKCTKHPCVPEVWKTCESCVDLPGTPRLNESKYRTCVESKCKQWTTRKVKVCN
ncbi:MAG: hypothetical protein HYY84_13820 [Deltaproteobacteria bacterium]|nr:hypothetical protein [Deltaproteobacteria bacterium]